MNGTRAPVHQSSSRIEVRKLFSITRSASVAVVSEMAPMWMTASSLRPSSQPNRSAGATTSATCRLARLRHLPSVPSTSLTTMSVRPASLRAATTFEPINPAPPVTRSIRDLPLIGFAPSFAPVRRDVQLGRTASARSGPAKPIRTVFQAGQRFQPGYRLWWTQTMNMIQILRRRRIRPILLVPYMWIGDFVRCHSVVQLLQGALSRPAGRCADHDAVRAAARLHAGRAQGHRLSTCRASAWRWREHRALAARLARRALRHGAGHAADLEIGAGAVARRHSRAHRLCRRVALRPAQRHPLRRKEAAPHDRPLRRAGAAERRRPPGRMAQARTRRAGRARPPTGAPSAGLPTTAGRWSPLRPARSGRASAGRCYFAELAQKLTAEGFAVWVLGSPAEAPLAAEIVAAAGPGARDLTSPDLRNAILALKMRQRLRVERLRPRPCRRRDRHADRRHLRPDQPVALGAAQSARRGDRDHDRRALPALPQADLPARPPPLHASTSRRPRCCPPCSARLPTRGRARYQRRGSTEPESPSWPTRVSEAVLAHLRRSQQAVERAVSRRQIRRRDRRHRRAASPPRSRAAASSCSPATAAAPPTPSTSPPNSSDASSTTARRSPPSRSPPTPRR